MRGRLTAEMTVALLDHTLFSWKAIAEERAMHPADERHGSWSCFGDGSRSNRPPLRTSVGAFAPWSASTGT